MCVLKIEELQCVINEKKKNQYNLSCNEVQLQALEIGHEHDIVVSGNVYSDNYTINTYKKISTGIVKLIKSKTITN